MASAVLPSISALTRESEHMHASAVRLRSQSDVITARDFAHDSSRHDGDVNRAAQDALLSNEAQRVWESLMTLHYSQHTPLTTHIQQTLPLLQHPSLPLPPTLQILLFTSSLTPAIRALILSHSAHIHTLDDAVSIAQMADRASARMDWIGRTMASSTPQSPSPSPPPAPKLSLSPRVKKRAREDEEAGEERASKKRASAKKRVKMALETERPGSRESYYSDSSSRSGIDYLADVAVEAAREQFERL